MFTQQEVKESADRLRTIIEADDINLTAYGAEWRTNPLAQEDAAVIVSEYLRTSQSLPDELWIVGRVFFRPEVCDPDKVTPWTFQGVFTSRELALAACRDSTYLIGPAKLNEPLPHDPQEWPGAEWAVLVNVKGEVNGPREA